MVFSLLVVVLALSFVLSACGSSPTATAAKPAATTTTATGAVTPTGGATTASPTAAAAATPTKVAKKGGVLVTAQSTDNTSSHFDVLSGGITGWMTSFDQIYEPLFGHDPKTFAITPKLGEKYEVGADAKSITITLKKGVKWHNLPPVNGREFTSEDVKWNIMQLRDGKPTTPYSMANFMKRVASVETPDKYTVKINFTDAWASITWWIADINWPMYPHELYEVFGDKQNKVAIGTGPFMFKCTGTDKEKASDLKCSSYEAKVAVDLTKNPDYYMAGYPLLDGYKIMYISDPAARLAALRSGQIQTLSALDKTTLDGLEKSMTGIQTQSYLGYCYMLWMNNNIPPFDNVKVRQAVNLALDRPQIIQLAFGGAADPVGYFPPSAAPFYPPLADLLKRPGYTTPKDADIANAKKLLAEAGYPNGLSIESLTLSTVQDYVKTNEIIREMMKKVGIDWVIKPADMSEATKAMLDKTYKFNVFMSTFSTRGDPDKSTYWSTKSASNTAGWGSAELDALLVAGLAEGNEAKRVEIYRKVDDKLFELANSPGLVSTKQWQVAVPELRDWASPNGAPSQFQYEMFKYSWFDK